MILEWIRFGLCAVCLITAMICFTAAVLGANRFGFIMNRLHAAGIGDTLGLFLVAVSIIIGDGFHMQELKMLMILVFMTFTSPVSSHFLTQLEYFTVLFKVGNLRFHLFFLRFGNGGNIQLIAEGAEVGGIGTRFERSGSADLVIGHGGNMRAHRGNRVEHTGAVLNL